MTKVSKDTPAAHQDEVKGLTVSDSLNSPLIYFEGATNFGALNGVVNITLVASRHLAKSGQPVMDLVAVAHLRCTVRTARDLRDALDKAILAATPASTQQSN